MSNRKKREKGGRKKKHLPLRKERCCGMKNPTAVCCRFYVFSLLLFVFRGSRLAPSEVYRVIALLAPALTPRALK